MRGRVRDRKYSLYIIKTIMSMEYLWNKYIFLYNFLSDIFFANVYSIVYLLSYMYGKIILFIYIF